MEELIANANIDWQTILLLVVILRFGVDIINSSIKLFRNAKKADKEQDEEISELCDGVRNNEKELGYVKNKVELIENNHLSTIEKKIDSLQKTFNNKILSVAEDLGKVKGKLDIKDN